MNNINYIKYFKIIDDSNKILKKNNINILKIGYSIKEVFQIFLNIINNDSKLIYLNSYKYENNIEKYFNNIIELNTLIKTLNKNEQVILLEAPVIDSINKLYKSKEYIFDMIYIDFEINKDNLLLILILCFELLNENGIIILDNYNNNNINDLNTPIHIIKTFMRIYTHDYNTISDEPIILQKRIEHKFKKTKLDKLFNEIYNYRLPIEPFILPSQKYEKLEWNIQYYDENEPFNINAELYKLYDDKNIIDKILEYDILNKNIKNLKLNLLDYNYFIQSKNDVEYDTYIEYLNNIYKDYNIDKYQIQNIIMNNILINNINYIRNIILMKHKIDILLQNIEYKNIEILLISTTYKQKYYNKNNKIIYNSYFNKNINIYNLFLKESKKYIKNENKNAEHIKNIKEIYNKNHIYKKKYDLLYISHDINHINIYYNYVILIYLILKNQNIKGSCIFNISLNILCNNIMYEILYILSLYYENIYIKNIEYIFLSKFIITFEYTNFKGIDNKDLIHIKKISDKLIEFNIIKSIINNIDNNWIKVLKKYINYIIIDKLKYFNNKNNFIKLINKKSYDIYKKYLLKSFKYQILYILNKYVDLFMSS
jgi:hypothetical protein